MRKASPWDAEPGQEGQRELDTVAVQAAAEEARVSKISPGDNQQVVPPRAWSLRLVHV